MIFAQAAWLWLLPVVLPLILLLHARRKRSVVVPSLVVWRSVQAAGTTTPSRRSPPWRDPLLWLQLLAAALLIFALARPQAGSNAADHWIVLLDASLSMNATDVEPDRFKAALEVIEERWGERGSSGRVSLISAGPGARLLAADWRAGQELGRLLEGLEPSAGEADWAGAAARAASLVARSRTTKIAVVTDDFGAPAAEAALAAAGVAPAAVEVVRLGSALANVGVGGVRAELRGDSPDQWTVKGRIATTGFERGDVVRVVASFRPPGSTTFLPWGAEEVPVAADGSGDFAIPLDLPGPGEVQVRGPQGDQLPADDAAIVSLRADPVRVAVVGEAHPALLRALAAVGGLEAYAADEVPTPAEAALFDLVIVTDDSAGVPATSTWWLGGVPGYTSDAEPISLPTGSLRAGSHPLSTDLDASEFAVENGVSLAPPRGASDLLLAGDEVLAWARTTTTGRQVAFGFDLDETDWISQVSFPAFVAALIDWSAPRSWSHVAGGCRVGESCEWPRAAFAGDWELLDPAGKVVADIPTPTPLNDDPLADAVWLGPRFDAGFTPDVAGSYTLVSEAGATPLAVVANPLVGEPAEAAIPDSGAAAAVAPVFWRWLAGLAAVILALESVLSLLRQRRVVRRRWRVPLALAAAAFVAVALGLLGVPVPGFGTNSTVAWVGPQRPPSAAVAAAGGTSWAWVPSTPANLAPTGESVGGGSGGGTAGLGAALEEALAMPRGGGELQVLVSGAAEDELSVAEAGRLASAAVAGGIRIDVVEPGESGVADGLADREGVSSRPAIRSVTLPDRVRAGSNYSLAVEVEAPAERAWRLEARLESSAAPLGEVQPDASDALQGPSQTAEANGAGDAGVALELLAGAPGELVYALAIYDAEDNALVAETSLSVQVGPPPAVLLVATAEERGAGLEAALKAQGLTVERTTPFRMPGTLERLRAYDSVLLVDVAANDMFPEYQVLLERYVRELGGGLGIVGGTSAFGPGGYYATPLEEVSPLSSRITDEAPEVSMAFVLDRSGSMSGAVEGSNRMDLAKAATLEAIGLLGERSLAAIVVFDTEARVVLPLTPVSETGAFTSALTTITPAGGTSIFPGLVAAHELMSASTSATRHVVVMTDGLSQEGDFAGVLQEMKDAGITTTFVGVGDAADRRQLTTLAALSGGTLHMALDFRALPSLLAQEALMLAATPIEEGRFSPRWAGGNAPEFLSEVSGMDLPALEGYVKTTLKDEATAHAFAAQDDPLLASWRYGLGRVVAFTSDGDGRWSQAWLRSEGYGRLWSQVVRWASEGPLRDPWSLRLGRRGEVLDVVVDLPVEAVGASATTLPLVTLARSDGERLSSRRLEWIGPSRAAAGFAVSTEVAGELGVTLAAAPELGLEQATTRVVRWPLPPGRPLRSDLVPLAGLAEATGGQVYSSASELDLANGRRALRWLQLPVFWLLIALAAFLSSLMIRFGVVPRLPAGFRVRQAARTRTA